MIKSTDPFEDLVDTSEESKALHAWCSETERLVDKALDPSHIVMRRLRTVLRNAMRAGPNVHVQKELVLALHTINGFLGD